MICPEYFYSAGEGGYEGDPPGRAEWTRIEAEPNEPCSGDQQYQPAGDHTLARILDLYIISLLVELSTKSVSL